MAGKWEPKSKKPTKEQLRWSKLSNDADSEERPFKKGSASVKIVREQKADKRNGGGWENSYATSREFRADKKNVARAESDKKLGFKKGGNENPRAPEGGPAQKKITKTETSSKSKASSKKNGKRLITKRS